MTDDSPRTLGRYRVLNVLGRGAFGVVHLAHDDTIDRPVAIKHLSPAAAADIDLRERFVREARLLQRGASERVVAVHDVGEADDRPYLVMEFATGGTLEDRIEDLRVGDRRTDARQLRRLLDELGACLRWLEEANVVHRDLKPSNVLVTGGDGDHGSVLASHERLMIGDFGLARRHTETAVDASIAAGTREFSAPEQFVLGTPVDARADQFAASGIVRAVLDAATCHDQALPEDLVAALRAPGSRGTSMDPEGRYPNAAAWAAALDAPFTAAEGAGPRSDAGPYEPDTHGTRPNRRGRRWAALVGLAVAAALAAMLLSGVALPDTTIVGPAVVRVGDRAAYYVDGAEGPLDWRSTSTSRRATVLQFEPTTPGPVDLTATLGDGRAVTTSVEVIDDGMPSVTSSVFPLRIGIESQLLVDEEDVTVTGWVIGGEVVSTDPTVMLRPRSPGVLTVAAILADGREIASDLTVVPDGQ